MPYTLKVEGRSYDRFVRRRRVIVAAAFLLIAIVSGTALSRADDDQPTAPLTIGWGGSEGHPSCVYDPAGQIVAAKITIEGNAPRPKAVTVTVTAHADENTSQPVGSGSRTVQVEGTVHRTLVVTIPVSKPPHVDVDGETACSLSVKD